MPATLLLVAGISATAATVVVLVRVRHPSVLSFPVMMAGWLTGEYPSFHFIAQAIVAGGLAAAGALDETRGIIGLVLVGCSMLGLVRVRQLARRAAPTAEAALRAGLGDDYLARLSTDHRCRLRTGDERRSPRNPVSFDKSGLAVTTDIAYGEHPRRNLLDIYRPTDMPAGAPVVVQIHGGAWIIGHKQQQAQPLLHRLARSGYVCVSINYRLGPRFRFPDQIIDVKRAIAWVREHIEAYGGDPSTIILTGGSAGGHLSSLAALTPCRREWQPGFEDADTSVAGCVEFYGPPDFVDRYGIRGRMAALRPFLERMVMPDKLAGDRALWDAASPVTHVGPDAPPFFIIQGSHDVLVWREEARDFRDRLRNASRRPVVYWEVPGAQHAFDTLNSVRSAAAVDAVERFVGWIAAMSEVVAKEESR